MAPNWLGDAVMALPLVADVRRAWPATRIVVAARKSVAPLFTMVTAVDEVLVIDRALARADFDAALLLPNSFASALLAWRAGIVERWGFARDLRRPLLTRAIRPPRRYGHQVEYYQALGAALGIPTGDPWAAITVSDAARNAAARLLVESGVPDPGAFAVFAPGAAYGKAKQWPPQRFAELAASLAADGIATVLVGSAGDQPACADVARRSAAIDLSGRTDLPTLAGVLSLARAVVANDSGAMHLAAAVGARVIAVFGPTDERKTAPLSSAADAPPPVIVSADVWCRPCLLRECPIDHRCMTRISPQRVFESLSKAAG
jgi:heptosyltransferase-2